MSDFTIETEDWKKLIEDHQLDKVETEELPIEIPKDDDRKDNT